MDYGKLLNQEFDRKLFQSALSLEITNPKRALVHYERLEKANTTLLLDVLLLSIVCPLLAFGIAFWVTNSIDRYQPVVTVVIMAVLGYGLPLGIFQSRIIQIQGGILRQQIPKLQKQQFSMGARLKQIVIGILWYFWGDYLKLFNILFWFTIFILPVMVFFYFVYGIPLEKLPDVIAKPLFWIFLIPAFAHTFSGRDIIPLFPIRRFLAETIAGLWLNRSDILEFISSIWISVVIVAGAWGLALDDFTRGLLDNAIAGVLLGLSISRLERDRLLENIIILGRIRCLLRLGRTTENYHWFRALYDYPFHIWFDEIGFLMSALNLLYSVQIRDRPVDPEDVVSHLDRASEIDKFPDYYRDIWLACVRESKSLLQYFRDTVPVS
jgi:hypothetical protein